MNSCILMVEIIVAPERRYTPENQLAVTEMRAQFPGLRAEEPAMTLKVVAWGNLAEEIFEKYHPGDRVIVEGRLKMNTIDRPEGFKEKRAELVASKIYPIQVSQEAGIPAPPVASSYAPPAPVPVAASASTKSRADLDEDDMPSPSFTPPPVSAPGGRDLDDIPF
jgi:single-strand DNA-binding protein